jgi:pyridinium-3,5-bisthiocarboxylic acid mononucleotide nickel chelatase
VKVAYIQSIGGASGDMLLGALLDLGVSLESIDRELAKLGITGYELSSSVATRCEVRGTKLNVSLQDRRRRSPRELLDAVDRSPLPGPVKERAARVLQVLWRAECRVHGESEDILELEELGTIDTLIDVVGFSLGLHQLGVERVYAAPLVLGAPEPPRRPGGYANPAPATLELVAMAGAPVAAVQPMHQGVGELTTPTGAAIITSLATFETPAMSITRIGVGLGGKDPEAFPNVVRVWLGEMAGKTTARRQGRLVLLETNLDDATGETLGYAQEMLFGLGALDVWHTPIQMKKNRPGVLLAALVPQDLESAAVELILRETPTLGVRTRPVERYVADRENAEVDTDLGVVRVKVKSLSGRPISVSPEFDDCRRIARGAGLPFSEVYQRALEQARKRFLA